MKSSAVQFQLPSGGPATSAAMQTLGAPPMVISNSQERRNVHHFSKFIADYSPIKRTNGLETRLDRLVQPVESINRSQVRSGPTT